MKPPKIFLLTTAALSFFSLVLLPACGPGQDAPNPVPVADASADAPPDAPADAAAEKDAGSSDAANAGD